jgi:hypothetical protein
MLECLRDSNPYGYEFPFPSYRRGDGFGGEETTMHRWERLEDKLVYIAKVLRRDPAPNSPSDEKYYPAPQSFGY